MTVRYSIRAESGRWLVTRSCECPAWGETLTETFGVCRGGSLHDVRVRVAQLRQCGAFRNEDRSAWQRPLTYRRAV